MILARILPLYLSYGLMSVVFTSASIHPSAQIGQFVNIDNSVEVDANARIGSFCNIGPLTQIKANSVVGEFTSIGDHSTVGMNSIIDNHCNLQSYTVLEDNVNLSGFVMIGRNTIVHSNARLGSHIHLSSDDSVGYNVRIGDHAYVDSNTAIERNVIVDVHSRTGQNVRINELTYIGEFADIGNNVVIGKNVVIHQFAPIANGDVIPDSQMVIATPTARNLFNIAKRIPIGCTHAEILNVSQSAEDSFKSSIMELMTRQWDELTGQCQSSSNPIIMNRLSCIVSIYLTRYYGIERFDAYYRDVNGNFMSNRLNEEYHFAQDSALAILSPEIQKEFIKLLAADQDINRPNRVEGDRLCTKLSQIHNHQLEVVNKDFRKF